MEASEREWTIVWSVIFASFILSVGYLGGLINALFYERGSQIIAVLCFIGALQSLWDIFSGPSFFDGIYSLFMRAVLIQYPMVIRDLTLRYFIK